MLRVIGQDDPATEPVLSAQLTEGIKQKNGGIFPISVLLTFPPGVL